MLTHAWIKRRDGVAGLAHAMVFYGFVVLFIGTGILAFQDDFAEPVLGWDFWRGPFYLGYSLFLDVFGALLIVGLVILAVKRASASRRASTTPASTASRAAYDALALPGRRLGLRRLAALPRGDRVPARGAPDRRDRPVVREVVARRLARRPGARSRSASTARRPRPLHFRGWWVHGRRGAGVRRRDPVHEGGAHDDRAGQRRHAERHGAGKELVAAAAEREAGGGRLRRRHRPDAGAPPAARRVHEVRQVPRGVPRRRVRVSALAARPRPRPPRAVGGDARDPRLARRCRRSSTRDDEPARQPDPAGDASGRACSAWPASRSARSGSSTCRSSTTSAAASSTGARWTRSCRRRSRRSTSRATRSASRSASAAAGRRSSTSRSRTRARSRSTCSGSSATSPRSTRATSASPRRSPASSTTRASTSGSSTRVSATPGNDVRRAGEEGLFIDLAESNIEAISACEFNRILTSDPHSFNTLRNEYPALGGSWDVVHHSQFLLELFEAGDADAGQAARPSRHLPRPLHARPLQRRLRRAARADRGDRLRARRDAAQPRQLVLLRRRRRADLDVGAARIPTRRGRPSRGCTRRPRSTGSRPSSSAARRT